MKNRRISFLSSVLGWSFLFYSCVALFFTGRSVFQFERFCFPNPFSQIVATVSEARAGRFHVFLFLANISSEFSLNNLSSTLRRLCRFATAKGTRQLVDLLRPSGRGLLGSPPTRHALLFGRGCMRVCSILFLAGLIILVQHGPFGFQGFPCRALKIWVFSRFSFLSLLSLIAQKIGSKTN